MDGRDPSLANFVRQARRRLSLRQFELVQSLRFREVRGEHRAPQQTRVLRLQARGALHHLGSRQVGSERELGVLGVEIVLVRDGSHRPSRRRGSNRRGLERLGRLHQQRRGRSLDGVLGRASGPASGARPAATKHGFTSASSNANLFACRAYSTSSSSNSAAVSSRRVLFRSASVLSANRTIRFALRSSTLGTDSAGMQSTNSSRRNARVARARATYAAYLRRAYASGSSVLKHTSTRGTFAASFDSYQVARGTRPDRRRRRRRRLAPTGDVPSYWRERTPRLWRERRRSPRRQAPRGRATRTACGSRHVRSSKTSRESTCGSETSASASGMARKRSSTSSRRYARRARSISTRRGFARARAKRRHHLRLEGGGNGGGVLLHQERARAAARGDGAAEGGSSAAGGGSGAAGERSGWVGGGSSEAEGASSETTGGAPGGARGRRREGASAWRVGGARSALEGRGGEGVGIEVRGGGRGQARGRGVGPIQLRSGSPHRASGWAPRAPSGDRRARAGANVAPLGADCTMSIVRTHASGGVSRENAGAMWARRCEARVHSDRTCAVGRPTGSRCV